MKKLTTILRFLLLATLAQSQTYTASITASGLEIHDTAPMPVLAGFDAVMVEWTAIGQGCTDWASGKLTPAPSYTLPLPSSFSTGLALQKTTWRGKLTAGQMKWQSQTSECFALVLPAPLSTTTDTLLLQPVQIHVPSSTYEPDWLTPVVGIGSVSLQPTALQPAGIEVEQVVVISASGYLMPSLGNLPAGLYFCVAVIKWQGMTFVENDSFAIF